MPFVLESKSQSINQSIKLIDRENGLVAARGGVREMGEGGSKGTHVKHFIKIASKENSLATALPQLNDSHY